VIGLILIVSFAAAQGFAVLLTAAFGLHLLKRSSSLAKFVSMALSYAGWVTFTIVGYSLLGGEGGLMDGFGLVLFLCFTALISSFLYLVAWTVFDRFSGASK
jgi:multidrug transporter EmrE-like cation transporter